MNTLEIEVEQSEIYPDSKTLRNVRLGDVRNIIMARDLLRIEKRALEEACIDLRRQLTEAYKAIFTTDPWKQSGQYEYRCQYCGGKSDARRDDMDRDHTEECPYALASRFI